MPTTVSIASTAFLLQVVSSIFVIGAIRGGILLLKDSAEHKGFAKVIRIISGIMQLLSIVGSIILVSVVYLNPQLLVSLQSLTSRTGLGIILMIIGIIVIISIITNIWGGILLIKESTKNIGFKKIIRIICGIIMIIALSLSFIINL
ncbi:MAG: hypothetical protein WC606_04330 [Candidatus Absconditabacterales bacterium]